MVGDINFFLTEEQDGMTGEINMMIAGMEAYKTKAPKPQVITTG